jgi:hypothetical protein
VLLVVGCATFVLAPLALAPAVGEAVARLGDGRVEVPAGATADVVVDADTLGSWAAYANLPGDPATSVEADAADPGVAADLVVDGPDGPVTVATPSTRGIYLDVADGEMGTVAPTRWAVAQFEVNRLGVYEVYNGSTVDVVVSPTTTQQITRGLGDVMSSGAVVVFLILGAIVAVLVGFVLLLTGLIWRRPAA